MFEDRGSIQLFQIDTPEKRLLLGILLRAMHDYVLMHETKRRIIRREGGIRLEEVASWLQDLKNKSTGSIFWILENISNDPNEAYSKVRKALFDNSFRKYVLETRLLYRSYGRA